VFSSIAAKCTARLLDGANTVEGSFLRMIRIMKKAFFRGHSENNKWLKIQATALDQALFQSGMISPGKG
jgi:hypothetical protein